MHRQPNLLQIRPLTAYRSGNEKMTSCGFKSLVSSPCGSSKYQKQASESIILLKCTKDIKGHLKRLNTYDSNLKKEATLILARAGKCNNTYVTC
jgi:hypothetical protein